MLLDIFIKTEGQKEDSNLGARRISREEREDALAQRGRRRSAAAFLCHAKL